MAHHGHASHSGGRTPGSQDSRRPRHPVSALMAGVNHGPVPLHRAYRHIHNRKKCTCGTQSSKLNTCTISMICGMTPRSAPHRESSNCETIAVSCTLNQASVVAHNGHVTTTSCNNELQLWDRGCLLPVCTRNCWTCTTDIEHRVNGLQLRNHNDLEKQPEP